VGVVEGEAAMRAIFSALAMLAAAVAFAADMKSPAPAHCIKPIADLCKFRECEPYDAEVERVRRSYGIQVSIGTCDEMRYISTSSPRGGTTLYFDAAGHVVAAQTYSDAGDACGFTKTYAKPMTCPRIETEGFIGTKPGVPYWDIDERSRSDYRPSR
jgi:hypothetical protein